MKVSSLVLVAAMVVGFQASAMPALEGKYTCSVAGAAEKAPVELQVREDKLFIVGLDAGVANSGLPCSNDTQSGAAEGINFTLATTCNEQALTFDLTMNTLAKNETLNMFIGITLVNPNQVDMSFKFKGTANGTPIDQAVVINCLK